MVNVRAVQSDPSAKMPGAPERKPNSCGMADKQILAYRMDGKTFEADYLLVAVGRRFEALGYGPPLPNRKPVGVL